MRASVTHIYDISKGRTVEVCASMDTATNGRHTEARVKRWGQQYRPIPLRAEGVADCVKKSWRALDEIMRTYQT